ncbi:MAG: flagellar export chaperone FliS [Terracidiphilus sp.]|jgi:flagellar protein FliS
MSNYREHALEGASAVDLVVALYDGIIRFLYAAVAAVEHGDADARRAAVKRALDIIFHLQARLRMDVGGRPAQSLSEFYAAIFAQILQASQSASKAKFEHAIDCVRNVRDAWREVAKDPNANPASSNLLTMPRSAPIAAERVPAATDAPTGSSWTA